jgi:hypothetical protein
MPASIASRELLAAPKDPKQRFGIQNGTIVNHSLGHDSPQGRTGGQSSGPPGLARDGIQLIPLTLSRSIRHETKIFD